jgi:gliding motility-associated-like protein
MSLKNYILSTSTALLIILFNSVNSLAQVSICLGTDTTVCTGTTVTITNCASSGGVGAGGINLNSPTTLSLSDDVWSGVINIGFTFNFYGTNYTQCVIGSNGLVSFNLGNAGGYCPWSLAGIPPLPTTALPSAYNTAMLCYQDINPAAGGTIKYQTIGTAPNRIFVVLYENVAMFSTGQCNYMGLILFESSNNVEYHIGNKPISTWNSGLAIQGTEKNNGVAAHITPGRNNTSWTALQDGRRFTPTAPNNTNNYTITTIPYTMITSPTGTYQWANTLGQSFPYNNGVLNVTTVPPGTTGYFLSGNACGVSVGSVTSDTTWITRTSSSVTATSTPDICSSGIGTVTANPVTGTAPYTYNWPLLGATTQTVNNVNGGATYSVTMTDAFGCISTASVIVGDTPAAFNGTTTLVSCPGGTDGTATANMVPVLGNITYLWDDPLAQTTQTAVNLSAGNYTCLVTSDVGCTGTVNVTVSEIPGMLATFTNAVDATCNSGNDGILEVTVTQGTAPYSYSWDNSTSILNTANDLYAGTHTVTITDANGCIITATETIGEPPALVITSLTPNTQICPEDDITLTVTGTGGSSAYTFTWKENGNIIGTGTSILVDPNVTNTQYCVTLSEACGSPETDSCLMITFPTPIQPIVAPDRPEDCIPGDFIFSNNSTNSGEIATTYYSFSDGNAFLETGADTLLHIFPDPNQYSVTMTITSIYGCVYEDSFINIVNVRPLPEADFTFSSNPATFFETVIQLQDRSSADVIDWQWFSPGSNPTYSFSENPVFTYPEGEIGEYPVTLVVTTEYGCTDTVTYIMNVVQDIIFYAPNSFTPDGDEHNQSWGIYVGGLDVYNFDLFVFDRWGEVIWESHDPSVKWDGTYKGQIVPEGTYVWRASAKDALNDGKYEFNGYINVLR